MPSNCPERCFASEEVREGFAQSAMRYSDQSGFYANQSQAIFLQLSQQYNATAQNTLEKNGMASELLALGAARAAAGQPQATP